MSEMRIGPDGRDDALTRALRQVYAAPTDATYWDGLQHRIMARIAADGRREDDAWWSPFGEWVRAGLIAAGIAGVIAVAGLARAHETESRVAVQTIVEVPRELPQQMATGATQMSAREATLRYVIEQP